MEAAAALAGGAGGSWGAGGALAAAAGRAACQAAEAASALGAPLPRGATRGLCRGCGGPLFDPGARGRKGKPGARGSVGVEEPSVWHGAPPAAGSPQNLGRRPTVTPRVPTQVENILFTRQRRAYTGGRFSMRTWRDSWRSELTTMAAFHVAT